MAMVDGSAPYPLYGRSGALWTCLAPIVYRREQLLFLPMGLSPAIIHVGKMRLTNLQRFSTSVE
jgi:hypothetical protein